MIGKLLLRVLALSVVVTLPFSSNGQQVGSVQTNAPAKKVIPYSNASLPDVVIQLVAIINEAGSDAMERNWSYKKNGVEALMRVYGVNEEVALQRAIVLVEIIVTKYAILDLGKLHAPSLVSAFAQNQGILDIVMETLTYLDEDMDVEDIKDIRGTLIEEVECLYKEKRQGTQGLCKHVSDAETLLLVMHGLDAAIYIYSHEKSPRSGKRAYQDAVQMLKFLTEAAFAQMMDQGTWKEYPPR